MSGTYTIIDKEKVAVEIYLENLPGTFYLSVLHLIKTKHSLFSIQKSDKLSSKTLLIDYTSNDQLLFTLFSGKGLIEADVVENLMKMLRQQKINQALA